MLRSLLLSLATVHAPVSTSVLAAVSTPAPVSVPAPVPSPDRRVGGRGPGSLVRPAGSRPAPGSCSRSLGAPAAIVLLTANVGGLSLVTLELGVVQLLQGVLHVLPPEVLHHPGAV